LILIVGIVVQEYRIHKLVNRMMLQANIPQLTPVRINPITTTETPQPAETRRLLFKAKIPS